MKELFPKLKFSIPADNFILNCDNKHLYNLLFFLYKIRMDDSGPASDL